MSGTGVTGIRLVGLVAGAAAAVLVAALALGTDQAKAVHVSCGQTVTGTVKLDSNLLNCPGDGLRVGGPNVTIDLNGFTIDGNGSGNGSGIANFTGVHPGLTVINGTIQEFANGVFTGGAGGRFERLRLRNNVFNGIQLNVNADRNRVVGNTVTGNGNDGIQIASAVDNVVDLNTVIGNGAAGIVLADADRNRVTRNTVSANVGDGIAVIVDSDNNQIVGNQSNANRGDSTSDGIEVSSDSDNNIVDTNTTSNNRDDGIDVDIVSTTITRNTARNNGDWGIESVFGVRHSGNRASGNGQPGQCTGVSCTA
jgi:parallel beta-helix repeat protein